MVAPHLCCLGCDDVVVDGELELGELIEHHRVVVDRRAEHDSVVRAPVHAGVGHLGRLASSFPAHRTLTLDSRATAEQAVAVNRHTPASVT
jgi:hypothetical protein